MSQFLVLCLCFGSVLPLSAAPFEASGLPTTQKSAAKSLHSAPEADLRFDPNLRSLATYARIALPTANQQAPIRVENSAGEFSYFHEEAETLPAVWTKATAVRFAFPIGCFVIAGVLGFLHRRLRNKSETEQLAG